MDRLFKKRTISVREARKAPSRQNSNDAQALPSPALQSPPASAPAGKSLSLRKRGKNRKTSNGSQDARVGEGERKSTASGISEFAPSLNMDFRSSLILPSMEQRFSVLLPSLSAIPESSLRELLAGQRARNDQGPTITIGEEKLLLAELHSLAIQQRKRQEAWEQAPATNPLFSTVNLAKWEDGAPTPPLPQSRSLMSLSTTTPNIDDPASPLTPPPTSASVDSLATFGQRRTATRTYGFGGGSRLQEDAYLRRARKESNRNISASSSTELASPTSPETPSRPRSASGSDRTATPTSAIPLGTRVSRHSPSSSLSLNLPPQPPAPTSPPPEPPRPPVSRMAGRGNRQSKLAGLSTEQMKRISMALVEIGKELEAMGLSTPEMEQEILEEGERRERVDSKSESGHSTSSSVFPYHVSPTMTSFQMGEAPSTSPPRIPPSPKSLNLAQVATTERPEPKLVIQEGTRPLPVLTPTRTRPVRHLPTASTSSTSSIASAVPGYIPGQPRPVGRSDTSRSGTPGEDQTPTRNRAGSSPSPVNGPQVSARSTSLGRSIQSSTPSPSVKRNLSILESDPLLSHDIAEEDELDPGTPPDVIAAAAEDAEEAEDVHVQDVSSKYSVARSRSDARWKKQETPDLLTVGGQSRVASYQALVEGSEHSFAPSSQAYAFSTRSLKRATSYDSATSQGSSYQGEDILLEPPVVHDDFGAALLELTGIGKVEMGQMHDKLVQRARTEREALRAEYGESPSMIMSPTMAGSDLPRVQGMSRAPHVASPLASSRAATPAATSADAPAVTPTTKENQTPVTEQSPAPAHEEHDVVTPITARAKVGLEDDPDVRRDFEARIAAATAALQRHPSISAPGAKLERKNTKRGAIKISSPKLVSSSSSISATPLSPDITKALERTSGNVGSGRKMSLRWKKAFRKGPSITNAEVFSPPASAPLPRLEEPIALETPRHDLQAFRFPPASAVPPAQAPYDLPSPPGTANPTSGLKQMFGKMRRGKSDEAGHVVGSVLSVPSVPETPKAQHTPSASDDSTVAQFIAAGRALGLNNDQLHEMLAAKGVSAATASKATSAGTTMDRTETTTSIRSNGSAALTGASSVISRASASPVTPGIAVVHSMPAVDQSAKKTAQPDEAVFDKREGLAGLVRALSKKRTKKENGNGNGNGNADAERRRVVRRTLLMPAADVGTPRSPRSPRSPNSFSTTGTDSPARAGRKPSIRRKPIALSREDERLVEQTGSPLSHTRSLSNASAQMQSIQGQTVGLGFLGSERMSGESERDDGDYGEGIEITEYDNGQMVWNVVDGLRGEDRSGDSSDSEYTQTGNHSRGASFASSASGASAANLRSAPTKIAQLRPKTNLYFTSPDDVADLIDQLSRDGGGGKGRIDFTSPVSTPPVPSVSVFASEQAARNVQTPPQKGRLGVDPVAGQFEDAPSPAGSGNGNGSGGTPTTPKRAAVAGRAGPLIASSALACATSTSTNHATRRTPPAPINVNRANNVPAGGWSPKRQVYLRQGFGQSPVQQSSPQQQVQHQHHHQHQKSWQQRMSPRVGDMMDSPAESFTSGTSVTSGGSVNSAASKNVEDRLQALMDRLVRSGAARQG